MEGCEGHRVEPLEEVIGAEKGAERIYVSVRVRPLNEREITRKDVSDWECINETTIIFKSTIPERGLFPTAYSFDRVFGCEVSTDEVYEDGVKEVALSTLRGLNATIFAYGQTSSGKTYTMNGITDRAVSDVYQYIEKHPERDFVLKFSAVEIYNEVVRDLLSSDNAPLRILDDPEKGMVVEKLIEERVQHRDQLQKLLGICQLHRQIGETQMNDSSSRSHQIVKLTIESSPRDSSSKDTSSSLVASLNLVDLAGSERASQALSTGSRLKEGSHINRSLFTLGIVIRKLSDPKMKNGHIPYRDSKLTRLLQNALGGNARTAMICTMSPARSHAEQSKNTLFFASCAKEVATSARVNVVMSDKALVKHLQKEVQRLENQLRAPTHSAPSQHYEVLLKEKDLKIDKLELEIKRLTEERDTAQTRVEELLQTIATKEELIEWGPVNHADKSSQVLSSCREHRISDASSTTHADCQYTVQYDLYNDGRNKVSCDNHPTHSTQECGETAHIDLEDVEASSNSTPTKHPIRETVSNPMMIFKEIKKLERIEHQLSKDASKALATLRKEVQSLHFGQSGTNKDDAASILSDDNADISSVIFNKRNSVSSNEIALGGMDEVTLKEEIARLKTVANAEETIASLEEQLRILQKPTHPHRTSDNQIKRSRSYVENPEGSTPSSPSSSCTSYTLERRHSIANLTNFSWRHEGLKKRLFDKGDGEEADIDKMDVGSYPDDVINVKHNMNGDAEENINNIRTYVSELKERVAKLRYQKQLLACQVTELDGNGNMPDYTSTKDETASQVSNLVSATQWPLEFDLQRMQIFELWDACYVSMIHRTHFFLLFKGDPSDAIYLEVELRRLVYLKKSFTEGTNNGFAHNEGHTPTLASSVRELKREREMFVKQMQKKFSAKQRQSLFKKWGIPLDSKQRRWQLAHKLWTDTKDMAHIQDSADIVATLVGFWEPGQSSKEMFELSFTPVKNKRLLSSGWHIISSIFNK